MNKKRTSTPRDIFRFRKNLPGLAAFALLLIFLAAACSEFKRQAYEGKDRDTWQQPERVISELALQPGNRVADLGSGSGYFTIRLARAVGPQGRVYAVDVDQDMNEFVLERAKKEKVGNVETILAGTHDPLLPQSGVDMIFASNSYHHLEDRVNYFKNVKKYLRPSGRVAIIDFRKEAFHHNTPSEVIRGEMKAAGYTLLKEYEFLPRQHFLIFSK